MSDTDCIFCKISVGVIPSYKIWENDDFFAILDINPNVEGMTLVLTKEHQISNVFDLSEDLYSEFLLAAREVAALLEQKLEVARVAMAMEGMAIDHAHIKLYPLHGLPESFEPVTNDETIYFQEYQGYITTLLGPRATDERLTEVHDKICS